MLLLLLYSCCVFTYKSRAVVAEGGFHVCGLLEVVDKPETQFGADDTGTHEIGCDLISVDKALPGHANTYMGMYSLTEQLVAGNHSVLMEHLKGYFDVFIFIIL